MDKNTVDDISEKVAKNYRFIEGAQISNSFVILMALSESKQLLTATQISEKIAARGRSDTITMSVLETLKQENPELYRQIYVPSTRNISQSGIHFKMV